MEAKESDLGVTLLEKFFQDENDALIDCLCFDNSRSVIDAVKGSLRRNMAKLASLSLNLVNLERF